MGAGGGGGGGADRGVNRGAGGLEGVAAGGGGGATGSGGGAAPLRSRVARAGGSCFVAAATTFSFPMVCWAAIIFVPRGQPTVVPRMKSSVSLHYPGLYRSGGLGISSA